MKGLLVEVYRGFYNGKTSDCTNGGASSKFDSFVLVGTNPINKRVVSGPFDSRPDTPELVLVEGPYDTVRAVPRELLDAKVWVMFGGNFCYTSDSHCD